MTTIPVAAPSLRPGVAPTHILDTKAAQEAFPELMCQYAQRAEWQEVKVMAAQQLGSWRAGVAPLDTVQLRGLLESAVQRLQGVHGFVNECGMGRLSMSVLAVLAVDAQHSLHGAPSVHAPLLTVLLDMPWSLVVWSGWPLFALLAQLHLRSHGSDDLPTAGPAAEYLRALELGLREERPAALARAGADFLRGERSRVPGSAGPVAGPGAAAEAGTHAMPVLCALASQLLGPDAHAGAAAEEALQQLQGLYRQSVQSMEDLHASVVSVWPLYGVLHAATLQLGAAALPEF